MKILFTNPTPMIKYGMQMGFEKNGWNTARIEVPEQTVEGLSAKIEAFLPDYLFTEGGVETKRFIYPVLEKYQIPHIYWAVEDPVGNSGLAMEWSKRSVLSLTPDIEMLSNYEKSGFHAICTPFAIDPDYYHKYPSDLHFAALDAVHVGNNYDVFPERRQAYEYIIKPFIDHGKAVEIYGSDWENPNHRFNIPHPYDKGYLAHEKSVVAYSSAKIVLGVHSITNSRTMQSMRTFEVLGCRGFFLTQHTRAIETMFENHRHLVWSSSYAETEDLMEYYLNHESARKKIAEAGQRFVYENHTYEKRAREIIAAL
ncbi:Spore protein YkvP [bioreactor metagenome]|uniref:Spore protein YkvP n=1 Tax=bioreactor metagenome TaxID=1076179 RepID=A0A644XTT7_9ZZZZ|nr:glycosyltransferase [Oscillibacter sp.]